MHKVDYLAHNWLIIKKNNEVILRNFEKFKGIVYDLGCGERPYEEDILKTAEKYIGVDWGATMHELKADIVSDLNKPLPIDSEVAGTVTSFQVMEHLCEPQVMLNEAHRILKRGGNIIVTVPFQWWVHEAPYDFFRYTPYGLRYMFEKSGFVGISITPTTGVFTMLLLKINYFSRRWVDSRGLLGSLLRLTLTPVWYVTQILGPVLDKFDRQPELETTGYTIVAKKV